MVGLDESTKNISVRLRYRNYLSIGCLKSNPPLSWLYWHHKVVSLSVTLCIVAKRCIIQQQCLNKWIGSVFLGVGTRRYNFQSATTTIIILKRSVQPRHSAAVASRPPEWSMLSLYQLYLVYPPPAAGPRSMWIQVVGFRPQARLHFCDGPSPSRLGADSKDPIYSI